MIKNIFNIFTFLILLNFVYGQNKGKGKVYSAAITNSYDQVYSMQVLIGKPPQKFSVMLSTGSADFWVTAFNVSTNKPRFYPSKSSTYTSPKPQKYLNFPSVQGIVGIDTIQFAGLIQDKLEFSTADIIDPQTLAQHFDGIMGLAFPKLSNSKTKNPVMAAIDNNLLANKMFTLYLKGGYGSDKKNMPGGQATFGDYDRKNCGKIIGWVNIYGELHYQFQIDSISSQGKKLSDKTQAISDSSSSVIFGNQVVTDNFAKQVGASWNNDEALYIVDCKKNISTITFKIGGVDYTLTKDVLIFTISPGQCALTFVPIDKEVAKEGYDWILGSPFMRMFCHTFDVGNNRLGFSQVLSK